LSIKKFIIYLIPLIVVFFLGAQFHKQEIWPFGKGYYHSFKMIKKYGLDYKNIVTEEQQDRNLRKFYLDLELKAKDSLRDFSAINENTIKIFKDYKFEKYLLQQGIFNLGISNLNPGSGYLDFYHNNLFLLSSRGILSYSKKIVGEKLIFKQIKNNLNTFLNSNQFLKPGYKSWFSFKDLTIIDNKIFISFTEEISQNCWNTSVIFSEINYENIIFTKLFSSTDCINHSRKFNASEAGGRIVNYDQNHILLSVGNYGFNASPLSQDQDSINGKILKINIKDTSYEIISMGHRNPQGLYYDKKNNFLVETEHGPSGGDEINIIKLSKNLQENNYGWPLASYGMHYSEDEPISKNHKSKGFVEPIKYYFPSIGISEIVNIGGNRYVVGSMREDKAIRFFEINSDNVFVEGIRIPLKERVRDIKFKNNKLFLFLEDTASIGIITLQ
jgi:hypothetical protein